MKEKYREEINKIYNALYNSDIDFYYLDEYSFEEEVVNPFKEKYKESFGWDSGATKGVLIFKQFDFVIKIPYTSCDGDELIGAVVKNSDDCWNYCQAELERYERACQLGIQDAFAEIDELFDLPNGFPAYIQKFCDTFAYAYPAGQDYIEEVSTTNLKNSYSFLDELWENTLYTKKGKDFFCKVKEFIKIEDINDLRRANIGYLKGQPVLIDYAGFDY